MCRQCMHLATFSVGHNYQPNYSRSFLISLTCLYINKGFMVYVGLLVWPCQSRSAMFQVKYVTKSVAIRQHQVRSGQSIFEKNINDNYTEIMLIYFTSLIATSVKKTGLSWFICHSFKQLLSLMLLYITFAFPYLDQVLINNNHGLYCVK